MNPSRIFILRPVGTTLLMVVMFLVGVVAYGFLPVSALPEVDYPTIQVSTFYPRDAVDPLCSHPRHDLQHAQRVRPLRTVARDRENQALVGRRNRVSPRRVGLGPFRDPAPTPRVGALTPYAEVRSRDVAKGRTPLAHA
jgi:hypothetical protein